MFTKLANYGAEHVEYQTDDITRTFRWWPPFGSQVQMMAPPPLIPAGGVCDFLYFLACLEMMELASAYLT
jgi:hypothetical protein